MHRARGEYARACMRRTGARAQLRSHLLSPLRITPPDRAHRSAACTPEKKPLATIDALGT
jgi:hypothetical protein